MQTNPTLTLILSLRERNLSYFLPLKGKGSYPLSLRERVRVRVG